jgi:hypothetical protein
MAKIFELRTELKTEELKQHVARTGEVVLGILARYQKQTFRTLIVMGFSLGVLIVAVNARSSWGLVLACIAFLAVLQDYFSNFRSPKKDGKLIEHVDLLRSLARGGDNFRRSVRQKLLHAYERGESPTLDQSESDAYRRLAEDWEDDLNQALCPVLMLGWHAGETRSREYGRSGPIYSYLCDELLRKPPESKYSLAEKTLREMHIACFGEKQHKEFVSDEIDG